MPRKQITRLRTETLLGCIKYTTWLSWTERGKTVLVWDKSKTHTQTFNANHMLILNRRQILHCYVQSCLKGRKTELSCAEKCPFFSAIYISEIIKYPGFPQVLFLDQSLQRPLFSFVLQHVFVKMRLQVSKPIRQVVGFLFLLTKTEIFFGKRSTSALFWLMQIEEKMIWKQL